MLPTDMAGENDRMKYATGLIQLNWVGLEGE
jgi:hypothetical protein